MPFSPTLKSLLSGIQFNTNLATVNLSIECAWNIQVWRQCAVLSTLRICDQVKTCFVLCFWNESYSSLPRLNHYRTTVDTLNITPSEHQHPAISALMTFDSKRCSCSLQLHRAASMSDSYWVNTVPIGQLQTPRACSSSIYTLFLESAWRSILVFVVASFRQCPHTAQIIYSFKIGPVCLCRCKEQVMTWTSHWSFILKHIRRKYVLSRRRLNVPFNHNLKKQQQQNCWFCTGLQTAGNLAASWINFAA